MSCENASGFEIAADLTPCEEITGDDAEDTRLLRAMAADSKTYLEGFAWCQNVLECYFGDGVGGIFAVFFFRIQPKDETIGDWIWVMWGDVPPAYLPLADCSSPCEAFRKYIRGMSKWADLALKSQIGLPEDGVPPVNVPSTPEWGEHLHRRLQSLLLTVGPIFDPSMSSILLH